MGKQRDKGLPPEVTKQPQPLIITQERYYKLITPLFGGGAVTGEPDAVTVVRGTEIRGHLRFWWRACFGGRYGDVKEMKADEDRIWGAAAKSKSKKDEEEKENVEEGNVGKTTVQIMVEVLDLNDIKDESPYKIEFEGGKVKVKSIHNIPGYAAFPFRPPQKEVKNNPVIKPVFDNVSFLLTISFPSEVQKDIEGALWAWETFGGIGARTRRGFGALQLTQIGKKKNTDVPTTSNVVQWLQEHIIALQTTSEPPVKGDAPKNVSCLSATMPLYAMKPSGNAKEAWNRIIRQLLEFRQAPHGRTKRSKWPEAEAIRDLIGRRYYKSLSHPQRFPRAAFGLPIIFHFKDSGDGPDFDPHDSTLQGTEEGHDRLASPLILRPLLCNNNYAVGIAVVLKNAFLPDELLLKEEDGKSYQVKPHIDPQEVARVEPLQGQPDVLKAFMNYLEGK